MNEKQIDKVDYISLALYLFFGFFIWLAYKFSFLPQQDINHLLLAFTFAGPLGIFLMYYKRLRIPSVTVIWLLVGFAQWYFVGKIQDNTDFNSVVGSYADHDLNLLAAVLLLTIFRILSLLILKVEFMVAAWFSPKDNRKHNFLDYLFSIIGFIVLVILL